MEDTFCISTISFILQKIFYNCYNRTRIIQHIKSLSQNRKKPRSPLLALLSFTNNNPFYLKQYPLIHKQYLLSLNNTSSVDQGRFTAYTLLRGLFSPNHMKTLSLVQFQLKALTRKMAICCSKQEVLFSLVRIVNKQPNSFT